MSKMAKIELDGKVYEFPILEGTEGEMAIDISKLRDLTGYITLDPGYGNTGSCESKITFLDGEKGILRYRGYSIEDLAEKSNFLEVAFLLTRARLPNEVDLREYDLMIKVNQRLPYGMIKILDQFPVSSHPMAVLSSSVSALSSFYPEYQGTELTKIQKRTVIAKLLAQTKILAAYFYRRTQGLDPIEPDPNLGYCADFLRMMFYKKGYEVNMKVARALNQLLILHADHEQNCSTSTVRVVGSAKACVYSAVSSGINALWGPLHGGANQAVLEMLEQIQADGGDYQKFIQKAKDKDDTFRLMGFGHRVYKNFDPRANIIKKACDTVLEELGINDPLLEIAKGLEEVALKDDYFVERKLYPNVDFYSGIIYRALGIPTDMFTVMFALGRLPGWLAQWQEMTKDPKGRIARPRQLYVGENHRSFIPQDQRA